MSVDARIAVIIPFYQRTAGLLRRAIDSIIAQECVPRPLIVVVDDSSPLPPDEDLAGLPDHWRSSVLVERQQNAGPGAARNRGLELLPATIEFVAFLDSDDQWCPGHLQRASAALDSGKDFYFSNFLDIGRSEGGFEANRLIDLAEHEAIPGVAGAYTYNADLRSAVLGGCPIETSTVVFRRATFGDLRFRKEFRHAYEDLMFWFEVAARSTRIAFSSEIGTQYGTGVNVFRGITTGSDAAVRAILGSTLFRARVRDSFVLSPVQSAKIRARLQENRKAFVYELLHRLRRRRPLLWKELQSFVRADPPATVLLPWEVLRQTARWVWRGEGE